MPNSPTTPIAIGLIILGYIGIILNTSGGTKINHKVWIFLPKAVKSAILDVFFVSRFLHKDKGLKKRLFFAIPLLSGVILFIYQYLNGQL